MKKKFKVSEHGRLRNIGGGWGICSGIQTCLDSFLAVEELKWATCASSNRIRANICFVCDISDRTPMGHSLFLHVLLQYYCSEHVLINVCVVAETVVIINIGMNPKKMQQLYKCGFVSTLALVFFFFNTTGSWLYQKHKKWSKCQQPS